MNPEDKTKITVDIFGTQYKLVANSSLHYMKLVAEHVNEHMYRVAKSHPRLDSQRIAVLAAFNMADDYFKLKTQLDSMEKAAAKVVSIEEAYQTLKQQHEKLQQEHSRELDHMKERKQEEERLNEEYLKLQTEHEKVKQQAAEALGRVQQHQQQDSGLYEEYKRLQDEYAKLQSEYNEWIQLAEKLD